MPIPSGTSAPKTWMGEWDFAKDGGAISTITLRSNDGPLPTGSIIFGGVLDCVMSALSATGTMAFSSGQGAADLYPASGQAALAAALRSLTPAFTGATMIKLTADRSPTVVIATAPFTAGLIRLILFYR